jgi:hypothetical protein
MTNADPTDILDLLTEFPQAAGAFADMRRYVKLVSQFSDFPSAQAATRLRAELNCTTDPVREGELQYEIEVAERDARSTVPRIVWGSILVATYATFETGVKSALVHWGSKVPGASAFECNGAGQFLKVASTYAEREVGIVLFPDQPLKVAILELKSLRDSFAHAAGQMPSRRTKLHSSIEKSCARGYPIAIEDNNWIATPKAVAYYLLKAERAYKLFSEAVMEKYLAGMVPRTDVQPDIYRTLRDEAAQGRKPQ